MGIEKLERKDEVCHSKRSALLISSCYLQTGYRGSKIPLMDGRRLSLSKLLTE